MLGLDIVHNSELGLEFKKAKKIQFEINSILLVFHKRLQQLEDTLWHNKPGIKRTPQKIILYGKEKSDALKKVIEDFNAHNRILITNLNLLLQFFRANDKEQFCLSLSKEKHLELMNTAVRLTQYSNHNYERLPILTIGGGVKTLYHDLINANNITQETYYERKD
jgi:hypothetical protein